MRNLLNRHDIDCDAKPLPANMPEFVCMDGVEAMFKGISEAVKRAFQRPVGFVLDADIAASGGGLSSRWQSVSDRLRNLGASPPSEAPSTGAIVDVPPYKTVVGVWLMPDNRRDGTLEQFLEDLIASEDRLISYARRASGHAKRLGAGFAETDRKKSQLHTWLAWQERPGLPYGAAINAHYFRHDSAAANAFVAWFKRLYGIP